MANSQRNQEYYNEEAAVYSSKRYPERADNYVHFLFTRRRSLLLALLAKAIAGTTEPRTLLEVGCADGILLRSVEERYPHVFQKMVGVDISRPMVDAARALTHAPTIFYMMRDELPLGGAFSVALEIGVAALAFDTKGELAVLADNLAPGGYLLCSLAGSTSLAMQLARGVAGDDSVLRPYTVYEQALRERFEIVAVRSYGFYMPLLWRTPALARLLQPLAEYIGVLLPALCHEHLYLLKKRSSRI